MESSNTSQQTTYLHESQNETNSQTLQLLEEKSNLTSLDQTNTSNTSQQTNGSAKIASSPPPKIPFQRPKKLIWVGVVGIGVICAAIFGYRWWFYSSTHQETDDAYVTGHINPVNSRIAGTVTKVFVNDNQEVTQGQLLAQLDPQDYVVAMEQAKASLANAQHQADVAKANIEVNTTNAQGQTTQAKGKIEAANASVATAKATLTEAQAGVSAAQADLAQVQANLVKAKRDYKRYTQLYQQGAVSQQQLDSFQATYEALLAQQNAAQEKIRQANAKVVQAQKDLDKNIANLASTKGALQQANATTQQTQTNRRQYQASLALVAQAQANLKNAQLQLSYTDIKAPLAGTIGNKTVEIGQRLQVGQSLMAVVSDQPWIVANFKETQLEKMKPGQIVEIKIDSLSHHPFLGKVDSISPASGNKFTLLPSDNATGNFTKIVQRIPVKIVFAPQSIKGYKSQILPGMSAVVSVNLK
jgi:membrane fusion protein (multidrug efflux system)